VAPLERLLVLEIEYHRKLRAAPVGTADAAALHTSYALQTGYEPLLRSTGRVTERDIEKLAERYTLAGDARDVLHARDSLAKLLGLRAFEDR
jgi:hypothetical protein